VVQIDGGGGCVTPSTDTVQDGSYKPLSRPLFVYPAASALKRPEVDAFLKFYIDNIDDITKQALFVDLTDAQKQASLARVDKLKAT
jgi:phosphate transport system substrate-binding protein